MVWFETILFLAINRSQPKNLFTFYSIITDLYLKFAQQVSPGFNQQKKQQWYKVKELSGSLNLSVLKCRFGGRFTNVLLRAVLGSFLGPFFYLEALASKNIPFGFRDQKMRLSYIMCVIVNVIHLYTIAFIIYSMCAAPESWLKCTTVNQLPVTVG